MRTHKFVVLNSSPSSKDIARISIANPSHDVPPYFSGDGTRGTIDSLGDDAINRLINLVGHYEPAKAEEGTIRRLFGTSAMENIIHSASDVDMYEKEKSLFFKEEQKLS